MKTPLFLSLVTATTFATLDAAPARHLFLDPAFLVKTERATFTVNPPVAREVVIRPDRPWEQLMISFFLTVRDEDGRLRLWYICRDKQNRANVAYAESRDGVHWTKPNLGLVDYDGSRDNNLVGIPNLEGVVLRDDRAPVAERYVYLTNVYHEGLVRFFSPDGLRWTKDQQVFMPFESDTQNVLFWDERLGRYVLYLRGWDPGTDTTRSRKVIRVEFDDYRRTLPFRPSRRKTHPESAAKTRLPWIVDEMPTTLAIDDRDPPLTDIYNISAQPYPVDPSWYVGFPSFYRHRPESDEPPYENGGRTEVHFVGSTDGQRWHRYDRATYAAPALENTDRGNMTFMGTGLIVRGDEIWQYGTGFHSQHGDVAARQAKTDGSIVRYVQRIDGFVSLTTGDELGSATTQPVEITGERLLLNVDTGGIGELRVGLLDENGRELPGYDVEDCVPVRINATGYAITWRDKHDVSELKTRSLALRFVSQRTKLYSFRFE